MKRMPEEKILLKILKKKNISKDFEKKALKALNLHTYGEIKDFIKRYNLDYEPDYAFTVEENKNRLIYLLNEEFFKMREDHVDLFGDY